MISRKFSGMLTAADFWIFGRSEMLSKIASRWTRSRSVQSVPKRSLSLVMILELLDQPLAERLLRVVLTAVQRDEPVPGLQLGVADERQRQAEVQPHLGIELMPADFVVAPLDQRRDDLRLERGLICVNHASRAHAWLLRDLSYMQDLAASTRPDLVLGESHDGDSGSIGRGELHLVPASGVDAHDRADVARGEPVVRKVPPQHHNLVFRVHRQPASSARVRRDEPGRLVGSVSDPHGPQTDHPATWRLHHTVDDELVAEPCLAIGDDLAARRRAQQVVAQPSPVISPYPTVAKNAALSPPTGWSVASR
ncbi:MAG TPA: hypothetical protein VGJ95_14570 [Pseudonocardiaceae bacterium]